MEDLQDFLKGKKYKKIKFKVLKTQHLMIKAKINSNTGNIWEDVLFMSQASLFIGTKSQVSQLVNICVENRGGRSYMLNFLKPDQYNNFKNT